MQSILSLIDARLQSRTRLFEDMTAGVRRRLPPELRAHCWVCGFDNGCIKVMTDVQAFATPVHYLQREILKQLNAEFAARLGRRVGKLRVSVGRSPVGPVVPGPAGASL